MATNDLFWNEKATTFSNAFSNQDNSQQQYCNLNINAIHQSSAAKIDDPLQSKNNSFKNDERKVYGKNREIAVSFNPISVTNRDCNPIFLLLDYNNSNAKNDSNFWSKNKESQQKSLNLLNGVEKETEKRWMKKDATNDSTKNSSTLSLHIAAYENSIEPASNVADKEEDNEKQLSKISKKNGKKIEKILNNVKQLFTDNTTSTFISSPIENLRQQTDQTYEPETLPFKASFKLFNPKVCAVEVINHPGKLLDNGFEFLIEKHCSYIPSNDIDDDIARLKRKATLNKQLKALRGSQIGGGRDTAEKIDAMRYLIATEYYDNKELFVEGGTRDPAILHRREDVWKKICALLRQNNYSFNPTTVRKNFTNFISDTKQKYRDEDNDTGAAAQKFSKAEKYVWQHEKCEESATGINTGDLGCRRPQRKNKGIAASRFTFTPKANNSKARRPLPVFDEILSVKSTSSESEEDDEEANEQEAEEEETQSPNGVPSPAVPSPSRTPSRRTNTTNFFDEYLSSLPGNHSSRSGNFSPYRNPSTRSNHIAPQNVNSSSKTTTKSAVTKGIDGPITSGPAKKARDSVKEQLMKTGKSIMKASQAVATNAEKKGKLIDDIAETEAKRRKVQLEKEETQLQREKLELIKVQLEIEALKKQQQRQ